jgi:hypothetical protein
MIRGSLWVNILIYSTLVIYDRELSITERSVKWYDIVNNNSHIQGKYTVYLLPEGYVTMKIVLKSVLIIFQGCANQPGVYLLLYW